ncbi:hypothetical protein Pyn_22679 [Prunus yedoensis var. nudiflora]|uniref:Uncharacterized protein n=1 Tax=Prunus yedoensis var. nudiflora TaxID=2094558 RepID=A0A314UDV3_PRUYE|nr:hypothetical protein Pyn_22679 [Prunus yedoensis var. nudiflora]
MWVLVAKLKKEGGSIPETHTEERHNDVMRNSNGLKTSDSNTVPKERQVLDVSNQLMTKVLQKNPSFFASRLECKR